MFVKPLRFWTRIKMVATLILLMDGQVNPVLVKETKNPHFKQKTAIAFSHVMCLYEFRISLYPFHLPYQVAECFQWYARWWNYPSALAQHHLFQVHTKLNRTVWVGWCIVANKMYKMHISTDNIL